MIVQAMQQIHFLIHIFRLRHASTTKTATRMDTYLVWLRILYGPLFTVSSIFVFVGHFKCCPGNIEISKTFSDDREVI